MKSISAALVDKNVNHYRNYTSVSDGATHELGLNHVRRLWIETVNLDRPVQCVIQRMKVVVSRSLVDIIGRTSMVCVTESLGKMVESDY